MQVFLKSKTSYESPFPDYTIEGLDKIGEISALVIGIIITLIIAYIVAIALRRRNPPEDQINYPLFPFFILFFY